VRKSGQVQCQPGRSAPAISFCNCSDSNWARIPDDCATLEPSVRPVKAVDNGRNRTNGSTFNFIVPVNSCQKPKGSPPPSPST